MLDLRAPALNEYQRMMKRSFDLFICVICFPFWLILMAIIAHPDQARFSRSGDFQTKKGR